jgi:hypothetical protein
MRSPGRRSVRQNSADAARLLDDGKRFVVRADEKLTAFLEMESAIFGNWRDPVKRARQVAATPWFNHQGQAHIVSIAIRSPRSYSGKVEAAPWFRTWFSVDPQPASINPTVNISIVFIVLSLIVAASFTIRQSKTILARG